MWQAGMDIMRDLGQAGVDIMRDLGQAGMDIMRGLVTGYMALIRVVLVRSRHIDRTGGLVDKGFRPRSCNCSFHHPLGWLYPS